MKARVATSSTGRRPTRSESPPSQRDHQGHQRHRSHLHHEHLVQRQAQLLVGEGRHIHQHHVEGHRADHRQAHAHQHAAPVVRAARRAAPGARRLPGWLRGRPRSRPCSGGSTIPPDRSADRTGTAPASPSSPGLGVQAMGDQRAHPRTGEHRQALAEQLPGTVETAPVRRRALHRKAVALAYSPPVAKPCSIRAITISNGAPTPIAA